MAERLMANRWPRIGITHMVSPSTWRALNDRARDAAYWLEDWAKELRAECLRQNIDPFDEGDDETTVALKRSTLRHLISLMDQQSKELRRYAKPLPRSVRRSPPGFTP
jgi:hypothetical protein